MGRRVEGQRLAYYAQAASADHWDKVWAGQPSQAVYAEAERGELGYFAEVFPRYLPKGGRILEAGCGLGQYVLALHKLGYQAEGVEWGAETVAAVRARYPELPVRQGDVTQLDVPDGYYQGYISLGVVEHEQAGPETYLKEAYRLLSPGGVALISVPYFHPLRRLKARLGRYKVLPDGLGFYQYAFTEAEFKKLLRAQGFEIIGRLPYDGYKGLKDELAFLPRLFELPKIGWRIRKFFMNSGWLERRFGHMLMLIARRGEN